MMGHRMKEGGHGDAGHRTFFVAETSPQTIDIVKGQRQAARLTSP